MTKAWCYSFDNAKFTSGTFTSLEAALKDAQKEGVALNNDEDDSEIAFIFAAQCKLATNEMMFPDADTIIDHMACQADDIGGEYSEDYLDVTEEQEADLTKQLHELLSNWCKKNEIAPTFYTVLESKKYDLATLKEVK